MAAGRMNDHAGRLVHGDDVLVFVEDVERDLFGVWSGGIHRREHDFDAISGRQPIGDLGALTVDFDAAGTDDFAELDATVFGELVSQEGVESLTGFFGIDHEGQGLVGRELRGGHRGRWTRRQGDRETRRQERSS